MEIEKTLSVAAPAATVWALLLDPQVMGGCVPGMQSIDVISDVEYVSVIHVKIAFVSAKFKLRTTIVEQRAPHYLRTEGTGEDASVASSLKQQSEIFLTEGPDGQTELRIKVTVDVLGRLGTFGLSVMKTKADPMWDEFSPNLLARPNGSVAPAPAAGVAPVDTPATATPTAPTAAAPAPNVAPPPAAPTAVQVNGSAVDTRQLEQPGWLARLLGAGARPAAGPFIHVEVRRADGGGTGDWPLAPGAECRAWLREVVR